MPSAVPTGTDGTTCELIIGMSDKLRGFLIVLEVGSNDSTSRQQKIERRNVDRYRKYCESMRCNPGVAEKVYRKNRQGRKRGERHNPHNVHPWKSGSDPERFKLLASVS